ncbi:MAG TPA: DUF4336 domain-containing protein [Kofleriaceae bacterium]|nr:DUF4336 domain-containing protein [Kofleriaceae bacterium]
MSALIPVANDLWHVDGGELRQPGGVYMPSRATLVRLRDRSLLLYSPVAIADQTAAAIDALGPVAHIVAPTRIHHLFVAGAIARWPKAETHAAPGLAAKRPDLRFDHALASGAWRGGDELDVEVVAGAPKLGEAVFFHRASRALICADLVFHVTRPRNLRTKIVLAIVGAGGGRLAQSRAWRFLRRDRAAARGSVDRILAWPIERVAPCHGEAIAIDARGLARVVTRVYGGTPPLALAP